MEATVNLEPAGAVGMEAEDPSVNVYLAPVVCVRSRDRCMGEDVRVPCPHGAQVRSSAQVQLALATEGEVVELQADRDFRGCQHGL